MDSIYRSAINADVPPARPGEFAPLSIGPIRVWPPVVLAPMAGVTNYPFRAICKQFGAGLYVSEMITARGLVERHRKTLHLADFGPDESPRSLQLYGVEIPSQLLSMLPYVLTIVVVAGAMGRAIAPAAVGKPYTKS